MCVYKIYTFGLYTQAALIWIPYWLHNFWPSISGNIYIKRHTNTLTHLILISYDSLLLRYPLQCSENSHKISLDFEARYKTNIKLNADTSYTEKHMWMRTRFINPKHSIKFYKRNAILMIQSALCNIKYLFDPFHCQRNQMISYCSTENFTTNDSWTRVHEQGLCTIAHRILGIITVSSRHSIFSEIDAL